MPGPCAPTGFNSFVAVSVIPAHLILRPNDDLAEPTDVISAEPEWLALAAGILLVEQLPQLRGERGRGGTGERRNRPSRKTALTFL